MTKECVLPSSFKTCLFAHFLHHLITWWGGRLGREVGAMANTFYDKMQWLLPEAVGVLTWGRIPPGQG